MTPSPLPEPSAPAALERVLSRKSGSEVRPGQQEMTGAVESALRTGEHLLVEAGTGTGKTLAYLVPAILSALEACADDSSPAGRRRVVVATATKALQEQLTEVDLPFLEEAFSSDDATFRFAMLKGRGNYLCRAKLRDLTLSMREGQTDLTDLLEGPRFTDEDVVALELWSHQTPSGDRAEYRGNAPGALWSATTVDAGECPGASKCPFGSTCFFEAARARAVAAEVVVVNTHLYASHLATGGNILPEHDAVVFDEAHTLEDVFAGAFGLRLTPTRLKRLAARVAACLPKSKVPSDLKGLAAALELELEPLDGERVRACEGTLRDLLRDVHVATDTASRELDMVDLDGADDEKRSRFASTARLAADVGGDVAMLSSESTYERNVAWVESEFSGHVLRLAPVDVSQILAAQLFPAVTVVATSATLSVAGRFDEVVRRLGLTLAPPPTEEVRDPSPPAWRGLQVESPFEYQRQAYLYCPGWLPDPRSAEFAGAAHAELQALAEAAGGRTLGLFTSRAGMNAAAAHLRARSTLRVLVQDELSRSELLQEFRSGPGSVLLATQGFWTGVDLPGDALTLVVVDKLPFARPTDPLHQARREAVEARDGNAFAEIDLPQAAMLLAQGVGRLVRSSTDRGVVAVLDRRLVSAGYGTKLVASLPPLRRVRDRDQVLGALRWLDAEARAATSGS